MKQWLTRSHVLVPLSQHPEIYAHMQAEVRSVLAGRLPTSADLPDLPYTLQVFKETLPLVSADIAFTGVRSARCSSENYHIPEEAQ